MKKALRFLILLLILGAPLICESAAQNENTTKKEILFHTIRKDTNPDRLLGKEIEAFYYPYFNLVELTCIDTKETCVYIVSTKGEEILNVSFDSSISPYNTLNVPRKHGTYYIVVDTPVLYAEGMFQVE